MNGTFDKISHVGHSGQCEVMVKVIVNKYFIILCRWRTNIFFILKWTVNEMLIIILFISLIKHYNLLTLRTTT